MPTAKELPTISAFISLVVVLVAVAVMGGCCVLLHVVAVPDDVADSLLDENLPLLQ